jgi:hypothetical protein
MTRAKRVLGALMLMVLCASSWLMAARAGPIVSVVSPGSETLGNSFTVNITVTGAVDLYAFQFDLDFDPTILQATSVTEGAFLPSGGTTIFVPGTIDNTAGAVSSVADTLVGSIPGVNGNGDLVDIAFDAVGAGTSALTLANEIFLDSILTDITDTITFTESTVTVSTGTSVPEPNTLALVVFAIVSLVMIRRRKA